MSAETQQQDSFRLQYWNPNGNDNPGVARGYDAVEKLRIQPETLQSTLYITDVTLRDGQQQRTSEVTTAERVEVFNQLVSTGVDRIEIGHLGNSNGDQQLAAEIIRTVAERERSDPRYKNVKLQVLFGSQPHLIQDGVDVLKKAFSNNYGEDWQEVMADKVVVHVYDRLDEELRDTSSDYYSEVDSAERICEAARYAIDAGFNRFSISGEAATATSTDEAIQFHRSINDYLFANGAKSVNVNLANTYGYSPNPQWNTATLAVFDSAVKYGYDGRVSTSLHVHDDANSSLDYTMAAVVAGFDRIEGTLLGMGERSGNVATVDVVFRQLEQAMAALNAESKPISKIARRMSSAVLSRTVAMDPQIANNLKNWNTASENISRIFGPHAEFRWQRTIIGNPYKYDNGSGPHDQAMAAAISDPVNHPPYKHYQWGLVPGSMMGVKIADLLAIGDPEAIDSVTVANYAGGRKTQMIKNGEIKRAPEAEIEIARRNFEKLKFNIAERALSGVRIIPA